MAEALTAPFVMHGARDAIACGLVHIEEQVKAIECAVATRAESATIQTEREDVRSSDT